MKRWTMMGLVLWMVLAMVGFVQAQNVRVLTANEAVAMGATHAAVLTHEDLTTATTNTAQTFNIPLLAKQGFEVAFSRLNTPFVDTATNGNNTLTLKIGDGSDDDLFLASQELCSDGTEVFLKFGVPNGGTVALTATTTNLINTTDGWTNTVWIGATAAFTAVAMNQKVYTADTNVVMTITPHSNYAVSAMDAGEVEVFFRITDGVPRR